MITKVIEIELLPADRIKTRSVHQWDIGQTIKVTDAEIEDGTPVDFGNRFMNGGLRTCVIGNQVVIPAPALQQDRDLTAYVVITDENSETTVKEICIPVIPRPKPEDYAGEEIRESSEFQYVILKAAEVEANAKNAEQSANRAKTSEENAAVSASEAAMYASSAEASKSSAASSENNASTYATNASNSATDALSYKTAAESAKNDAVTAKNEAQTAATNASASKTAASESATAAATSETNAAASATSAAGSATSANQSKEAAATSETKALASKNAAASSASSALSSKNSAASSATAAATSETNAAASATAAQSAKAAAEAARDKAQEIAGGNYVTRTDFESHTNDSSKHVTNEEKAAWNSKSNFSGNYNDLTNKPTIPTVPTNVSEFTNDAGYLTNHQDISGKVDEADFNSHTMNTTVHITAYERTAWDNKAPAYTYGTEDLTAGSSALATGTLYFRYE